MTFIPAGIPEIQATLERLESLIEIFRSGGASTSVMLSTLREEIAQLDLLRDQVDSNTRARIEKLSSLVAGGTSIGPPVLTSIVIGGPAPLGDIDGAIPFLLNGTNFINVLSVVFNPGSVPATGLGNDTSSSTQLSGFTPALAPGVYDVVITTASGSDTLVAAFESWDADQIVAPAVAHVYDTEEGIITTGGFVDSWADQGAGAATLTGAGGTRPAYQAARFGDNLRHGLRFDGVDDVLALGGALAFVNRSVFCAFKWNLSGGSATSELVTGTSGSVIDFALDSSGGLITMRTFDANIPANRRSPDDPNLVSGATPLASIGGGSARLIGELYDGAVGSIQFFQNNTPDGAPVATTAVGANWIQLGAGVGNPCDGIIGGIVLVEDTITVADRAKLTAWMWGKWLARSVNYSRLNDNTPWFARDGAQLLALGDDIYMLGGWNSQAGGQFPAGKKVTNEVWKSVDKGINWALIKANDYTPVPADSFWTPRHTMGAVVHNDSGVDYLYVIGSDIYNGPQNNLGNGVGTSDVWRSPDGVNWTRITDTAPWGPRVLHMVASYNGALYVMGGLTDSTNANSALNDVWRSTDGGLTWTQLANAPWAPRGLVNSGQGLPIKDGLLWLMGGGTYVNVPAGALFNDVWSFDGAIWTQVLADGVAPWVQRQYHATFINKANRLCIINGVSDFIGTNIGDCWESDDGVTWFEEIFTPWRPSHADGVVAISDRVVVGPGNGQIGSPVDPGTGKVFEITRLGFAHP
jgi:hypothetical protein